MSFRQPRILLLGSNGQVGWELQRALSPLGELIAHDRLSCDLTDNSSIKAAFEHAKPSIVVNAAAYTAVDKAEQDAATADKINHQAVAVLADLARRNQALFVHYSTDYVFDGKKTGRYTEQDATNPLSIYGSTKLKGEQVIANSGCEYFIFRTSWVFAARGGNFAKTILRLASEKESLNIVADQIGAPTSAELIADVTAHAIRSAFAQRPPNGVYHLAAAGETNWYDYAQTVINEAVSLGARLKTNNINPIAASEYPLPAKRPANSGLDTSKLRNTFNLALPAWDCSVRRMLIELLGK